MPGAWAGVDSLPANLPDASCYVPIVGEAYPVSQYPSSPALQYRVSTRIWSLVYMYVVLRVLYDLIQPRLDFEILAFWHNDSKDVMKFAFEFLLIRLIL